MLQLSLFDIDHLITTGSTKPKCKQFDQHSPSNIVQFPTPTTPTTPTTLTKPTTPTPVSQPETNPRKIQWYRKFFWKREIPIAKIREWGGGDCRRKATYIKAYAVYCEQQKQADFTANIHNDITDIKTKISSDILTDNTTDFTANIHNDITDIKTKISSDILTDNTTDFTANIRNDITDIKTKISSDILTDNTANIIPNTRNDITDIKTKKSGDILTDNTTNFTANIHNDITDIKTKKSGDIIALQTELNKQLKDIGSDISTTIDNDSIICTKNNNWCKVSIHAVRKWPNQYSINRSGNINFGKLVLRIPQIIRSLNYFFDHYKNEDFETVSTNIKSDEEEKADEGDTIKITTTLAGENRGKTVVVTRRQNCNFITYELEGKEYFEQDGGYVILERGICW